MATDQAHTDYFEQLSKKLESLYSINFNDTGFTEKEWLERFGDLPMEEAINSFAEKYDLTPISDLSSNRTE